jgi:uncharacterized DUF497 family protein
MDRNGIKTKPQFEFDGDKSAANLHKHSIDFTRAQNLWNDRYILEYPLAGHSEQRFVCIGQMKVKYWAAVVTYRDTRIRLISVRRARRNEIELYEISRYEQQKESNDPVY